MKRTIPLLIGSLVFVLLAGCQGYRLAGTPPHGIRTVAILPVINQSGEPAIELQLAEALRRRIQFDGRLALCTRPEEADATIELVLTRYNLTAIAFDRREHTTPDTYRLRIDAKASLVRPDTGEVVSTSDTYGETVFNFTSDLTTSKRAALPRAAEELSKFVLDDLIESW